MKNTIKSLILFAAIAFLSLSAISVKAQAFEKKNFVLSTGLGFESIWDYDYGFYSGAASLWPTIYLNGEQGIIDIKKVGVISAGGETAFRHVSLSYIDTKWDEFYIGTRGTFHLSLLKVKNLDVYGGLSIGIRFYSEPKWVKGYYKETETRTSPYYGIFVGGRYYFNKNFGVFSELGYEITFIKFGFVFKF
ncbi:MAG: hypothetical protein PHD97_04705 [Bacteroidales bacterium]|nr:hypothetical protein [Bacteroidales bacterium]